MTSILTLTIILTVLLITQVYAFEQVYTDLPEMAGTIVIVDNAGNIVSTFEEGILNADEIIDYTADLPLQLAKVKTPTKIIDTVGKQKILEVISEQFEELEFFSLSLSQFNTKKHNQTFYFNQRGIDENHYKKLLHLMEERKIHAVIQNKYPFTDVKEAHLESKNGSSNGRILLEF